MKYFVKLEIYENGKIKATHYFVPGVVGHSKNVGEYDIACNGKNDEYSCTIIKDRHVLGEYCNNIFVDKPTRIEDGDIVLELSLLPIKKGEKVVKKYLKSQKETRKRDMDEFYDFVGKSRKQKRFSTGPLHPTSGMDPDLRAEYAGRSEVREKATFKPCFDLFINSPSFEEMRFETCKLNNCGDTFYREEIKGCDLLKEIVIDTYVTGKKLHFSVNVNFNDNERTNILNLRDLELGFTQELDIKIKKDELEIPIHLSFKYFEI